MRKADSFLRSIFPILAMIVMWAIGIAVVVFVGKHIETLYEWTLDIAEWALVVCVLVVLPLGLFRKTRGISATSYVIASYIFGTNLFIFSVLVVLQIWGVVALIIGLVFAGVGVLPVAFLASIVHREWDAFWQLAFGLVFTWGTRAYGLYLATKSEREKADAELDAVIHELGMDKQPDDYGR
jgi:hypothetical protein